MSCYHPSYIQRLVNKFNGEVTHKFLGSKVDDLYLQRDYDGHKTSNSTYSNFDFWDESSKYLSKIIQIPCGKCIGCRIDYSRSWADRMTYHVIGKENSSWFITLTYNDDFIETLECKNDLGLYSLNYDHSRQFMKDLRNRFRDCEIDFYLSGEYGGISFRPHFHCIVYNVTFDDLQFWKLNDTGDPIYISDTLEKLWKYGFSTISPFTWTSAAYTAKYVEKKAFGYSAAEYEAFGLEPEKCFCSRRPGIAYDFYVNNYKDIWKNNGLAVGREVNSSGMLGIPRYFRKLALDKGIGYEEFLLSEQNSIDRQNFDRPFKLCNSSFDLNRVNAMLKFEEENIIKSSENRKL